jgi:hypothetical protein
MAKLKYLVTTLTNKNFLFKSLMTEVVYTEI